MCVCVHTFAANSNARLKPSLFTCNKQTRHEQTYKQTKTTNPQPTHTRTAENVRDEQLARTDTTTHTFSCRCTNENTQTNKQLYTREHHTQLHTHTFVRAYTHNHAHTQVHTRAHTRTHTRTHTGVGCVWGDEHLHEIVVCPRLSNFVALFKVLVLLWWLWLWLWLLMLLGLLLWWLCW